MASLRGLCTAAAAAAAVVFINAISVTRRKYIHAAAPPQSHTIKSTYRTPQLRGRQR